MGLWVCPCLDPHLCTHHSTVRVQIILVFNVDSSTFSCVYIVYYTYTLALPASPSIRSQLNAMDWNMVELPCDVSSVFRDDCNSHTPVECPS